MRGAAWGCGAAAGLPPLRVPEAEAACAGLPAAGAAPAALELPLMGSPEFQPGWGPGSGLAGTAGAEPPGATGLGVTDSLLSTRHEAAQGRGNQNTGRAWGFPVPGVLWRLAGLGF